MEPMTFQFPVGGSNHQELWETRSHGELLAWSVSIGMFCLQYMYQHKFFLLINLLVNSICMYIHAGTVNTSNAWKQNPPPHEMFLYAPVTSNQVPLSSQHNTCSVQHKPLGTMEIKRTSVTGPLHYYKGLCSWRQFVYYRIWVNPFIPPSPPSIVTSKQNSSLSTNFFYNCVVLFSYSYFNNI